ncbi:acetylornithine/succinylornithine family transaminase [bacterium]|nr:acetylornithine/succinylornithine family transaminase [bacterium]
MAASGASASLGIAPGRPPSWGGRTILASRTRSAPPAPLAIVVSNTSRRSDRSMSTISPTAGQLLKERAERVLMPNYGSRDLALVRGEGCWAWDADGNKYLDFLAGIAVNNLGHCHPAVVDAIQKQAAKLIHTSNGVLIEQQIELAELLCEGTGMDRALFANSGAEVTEAAIKLARMWSVEKFGPSRYKIIVFKGSFHGRTYGAMSATWSPKVRKGFEPFVPGFVFAEFNDLEDVKAKWDQDVCAVMLETVQGEGGVRPATPEFLHGLRQLCTERQAVFVCDEVQCGMGRSGKRMAYQLAGVQPDLVPLAKALAGGFPLSALLAKGEFAEVFTKGRHGTTFGGGPLACAAGVASTRVLFDDAFLTEVGRKGCKLWGLLADIAKEFPDLCNHVRGVGLMQGLVLKRDAMNFPIVARRHGIIVNATAETVIRILPPLIVSDEELEEGARRIRAAMAEFAAS